MPNTIRRRAVDNKPPCSITISASCTGLVNNNASCITIKNGREWVDLTPEEIGELTVFDGLNHIETDILADFVWKVEAKIKEKNL